MKFKNAEIIRKTASSADSMNRQRLELHIMEKIEQSASIGAIKTDVKIDYLYLNVHNGFKPDEKMLEDAKKALEDANYVVTPNKYKPTQEWQISWEKIESKEEK